MSDIPKTALAARRTLTQVAKACELVAKWKPPAHVRESERVEILACLEAGARFLREAAPKSAEIADLLEKVLL